MTYMMMFYVWFHVILVCFWVDGCILTPGTAYNLWAVASSCKSERRKQRGRTGTGDLWS